jgi:hypothetical protein
VYKCVSEIHDSEEYYYDNQVSQNKRDTIDKVLESFLKELSDKGYSSEKNIAILDSLIDKIDAKVYSLNNSSSYEAYDMLEYIRSVIVSYKDLAKAIQYCEKDAAKVLPEAEEIIEVDEKIMNMQNTMASFVEEAFNKLI